MIDILARLKQIQENNRREAELELAMMGEYTK